MVTPAPGPILNQCRIAKALIKVRINTVNRDCGRNRSDWLVDNHHIMTGAGAVNRSPKKMPEPRYWSRLRHFFFLLAK